MQVVFPPEIKLVPVDGPFGAALAMFLVIRLASLIHIAAAAECLSLAAASGVSTQLVYDLIAGAAGSSAQFRHGVPKMQKADFGVSGLQMGGSFSNAMKELVSIRVQMETITNSHSVHSGLHSYDLDSQDGLRRLHIKSSRASTVALGMGIIFLLQP